MKKKTNFHQQKFLFLKEVFLLSITAFGGPQAHISMLFRDFVDKKKYITEEELIEYNALCSILPGPTSTQTITAIGYHLGGSKLAYLTLLIWASPAIIIMTGLGIMITTFQEMNINLAFTKFIQPMSIAFVGFAAWKITRKVIKTKTSFVIMVLTAITSFFAGSPYIFPLILVVGGLVSVFKNKIKNIHYHSPDVRISIQWHNFLLWIGVFIIVGLFALFTQGLWVSKPIQVFESFYRNGSLVFGGGQVLIPLLLTEFSMDKNYLTEEEFRIGFAFIQALPGPVFAFSSYIGALALQEYGILGKIFGGLLASLGIFLPGTFLIFFVSRIWSYLKQLSLIKSSLEGINGAASGMVVAAAFLLYFSMTPHLIDNCVMIITFLLLQFTRIYAPVIIFLGLILGFFF